MTQKIKKEEGSENKSKYTRPDDLPIPTYDCKLCGDTIDEAIAGHYERYMIVEDLFYCEDCLRNPVVDIHGLFEDIRKKIYKDMGPVLGEKWLNLPRYQKAGFTVMEIMEGNIDGCTVEEIWILQATAASHIE